MQVIFSEALAAVLVQPDTTEAGTSNLDNNIAAENIECNTGLKQYKVLTKIALNSI